jgi:hypothetical protein
MHAILETLDVGGIPMNRVPMNRVVTVIASSGVIFVGTTALAADSIRQPTMSKRQMYAQIVDCMKKRMSANKNSSYNEAMKACKDQINKARGNGALVASDTPAKR